MATQDKQLEFKIPFSTLISLVEQLELEEALALRNRLDEMLAQREDALMLSNPQVMAEIHEALAEYKTGEYVTLPQSKGEVCNMPLTAAVAEWGLEQLARLRRTQPDLVDSAISQIMQDNEHLRWSMVVSAYLDEKINLGKAAELLGLHEWELREQFIERGIPLRIGPADLAEAKAEVDAIRAWVAKDRGGQDAGPAR
jgi:predicted HTH domain antitoxin